MPSYRFQHLMTGAVMPGYRVLSASEDEIQQANRRLQQHGSPLHYVIDIEPDQTQHQSDKPRTTKGCVHTAT